MKKWILITGFMTLGLISNLKAAVPAPLDAQGHTLPVIDWVGANFANIDSSTGTNAIVLASGRNVVYGVIASSMQAANFLVFRDSATANVTSSTATTVFPAGTSATTTGQATTLTIKFPVPLKFNNGICVVSSLSPQTGATWTILYRPLAATE